MTPSLAGDDFRQEKHGKVWQNQAAKAEDNGFDLLDRKRKLALQSCKRENVPEMQTAVRVALRSIP
jgi:hypothetical protein